MHDVYFQLRINVWGFNSYLIIRTPRSHRFYKYLQYMYCINLFHSLFMNVTNYHDSLSLPMEP